MADLYRKRPVVIEAMRFIGTADELIQVYDWIANSIGEYNRLRPKKTPRGGVSVDPYSGDLYIKTLEGEMRCKYGDWVIKGVKDEFYPCANDIFIHIYEPVNKKDDELPRMMDEIRTIDKPKTPYEAMVDAIEQIEIRKRRSE